ncbi:MAG TPA: DUF4276 family protein [Archangium sp.]|uniref:DUF4276 family protein n=1 Tax=Archangium sp. TaxID=1872627 RepID=UPI002E31487C|nr:DUF4276 family protein [Archangium sp.]HEX5748152.1 DUF4276 family protein [Archangium sp.]
MTRLNIIVEGQTEETFVRDLLAPHLGQFQVFATARCVETGRRKQQIYRGGLVSYTKARKDIQTWLKQDKQALVSTMFDYYALPSDFPAPAGIRKEGRPLDWAIQLEHAFAAEINDPRFIPYIQVHEFEALLFSDVRKVGDVLGADTLQLKQLQDIRAAFQSPEHINDSPETAPSKRLLKLFPKYDKPVFGSLAVSRIGLALIRQECPHFASWLQKLESLGASAPDPSPTPAPALQE